MTVQTIQNLRNLKDSVRQSLKKIKAKDYPDSSFGEEDEYCAQGIINGASALCTDLAALTKSPNSFLEVSTFQERKQLVDHFGNLDEGISDRDLEKSVNSIEKIKPLLRNVGIRNRTERQEELQRQIESSQKSISEIEEMRKGVKSNHEEIVERKKEVDDLYSNLEARLDSFDETQSEADKRVEEAKNVADKIDEIFSRSKKTASDVEGMHSSVKSHEEAVSNFSEKVSARETQIENQEEKTRTYVKKLSEFDEKNEEDRAEARRLIESAKTALRYKTAEGLSAAFQEKYNEARSDWSTALWILASGFFVTGAVGIGVWIFWDGSAVVASYFGRVSMIPILIGAAWFCAGQYVKKDTLAEDYAYKSVLTKSLVGFSEHLDTEAEKGQEYKDYIQTVLEEIHKDPLRKNRPTESFRWRRRKSERSGPE